MQSLYITKLNTTLYREADADSVAAPSGKTWYSTQLQLSHIGLIQYSPELVGDTLDDLDAVVQAHKDKDVILLGFSQGGNVVDTYLARRYNVDSSIVKGAIIISGYSLVDAERKMVSVPLLNVVGNVDTIVAPNLYPTEYRCSELIVHPDGHIIPKTEYVRKMLDYVKTLPGISAQLAVPTTKTQKPTKPQTPKAPKQKNILSLTTVCDVTYP